MLYKKFGKKILSKKNQQKIEFFYEYDLLKKIAARKPFFSVSLETNMRGYRIPGSREEEV
jgi:hypothetical protein